MPWLKSHQKSSGSTGNCTCAVFPRMPKVSHPRKNRKSQRGGWGRPSRCRGPRRCQNGAVKHSFPARYAQIRCKRYVCFWSSTGAVALIRRTCGPEWSQTVLKGGACPRSARMKSGRRDSNRPKQSRKNYHCTWSYWYRTYTKPNTSMSIVTCHKQLRQNSL